MACSSSNNCSDKLLATSVLPTPVGPRKRNEPIGRLSSESPARERRIALAMAEIARSCPMTRSPIVDSSFDNFVPSSSINRSTGIPVHRATTAAISSGVTSSRSMRSLLGMRANSSRAAANFFSYSGISPYLIRLAVARSASRSAMSSLLRSASMVSAAEWTVARMSFSCSQRAWRAVASVEIASMVRRISSLRTRALSDLSFFRAACSISSWSLRFCNRSSEIGILSSCIFSALVASSSRSTALSGKNRSGK